MTKKRDRGDAVTNASRVFQEAIGEVPKTVPPATKKPGKRRAKGR